MTIHTWPYDGPTRGGKLQESDLPTRWNADVRPEQIAAELHRAQTESAVLAAVAMVQPSYPLGAMHALQTSDEDPLTQAYRDGAHAASEHGHEDAAHKPSKPRDWLMLLAIVAAVFGAVAALVSAALVSAGMSL